MLDALSMVSILSDRFCSVFSICLNLESSLTLFSFIRALASSISMVMSSLKSLIISLTLLILLLMASVLVLHVSIIA